MSMKGFIEGECGGPNPLAQLASQIIEVKNLTQDAHSDQSLGIDSRVEDPLVEEFLAHSAAPAPPSSFRMDTLLREMQDIERLPPLAGPPVADLAMQEHKWAEEYLASETNIQDFVGGPDWTREFLETQHSLTAPDLIPDSFLEQSVSPVRDLDASRVEAMYDAMWREQENDIVKESAKELLDSVDDPSVQETNFMSFVRNLATDKTHESSELTERTSSRWVNEFLEADSNTEIKPKEEKDAFWQKMEAEWNEMANLTEHPWLTEYANTYSPFKEYSFSKENPYTNTTDAFQQGLNELEKGDISSAILLFESAVTQESNNSEAWFYLGTALAENEQDPQAIPALRRCVELEPSHLKALMALAVSYTNESFQNQACVQLRRWITLNPAYKNIVTNTKTDVNLLEEAVSSVLSGELHDEVLEMYLQAARSNSSDQVRKNILNFLLMPLW